VLTIHDFIGSQLVDAVTPRVAGALGRVYENRLGPDTVDFYVRSGGARGDHVGVLRLRFAAYRVDVVWAPRGVDPRSMTSTDFAGRRFALAFDEDEANLDRLLQTLRASVVTVLRDDLAA
jgi:hypothetical protein